MLPVAHATGNPRQTADADTVSELSRLFDSIPENVRTVLAPGWDGYDEWGSVIGALFSVAEVYYASTGEALPEYRPGMTAGSMSIDDYAVSLEDPDSDTAMESGELAYEMQAGTVVDSDLETAFEALGEMGTICRSHGWDY